MKDLNKELEGFTSTEDWHSHITGCFFTDGVHHLTEKYDCYWLVDFILRNHYNEEIKNLEVQVWILEAENKHVKLTCRNQSNKILFTEEADGVDLEGRIELHLKYKILHLP